MSIVLGTIYTDNLMLYSLQRRILKEENYSIMITMQEDLVSILQVISYESPYEILVIPNYSSITFTYQISPQMLSASLFFNTDHS